MKERDKLLLIKYLDNHIDTACDMINAIRETKTSDLHGLSLVQAERSFYDANRAMAEAWDKASQHVEV